MYETIRMLKHQVASTHSISMQTTGMKQRIHVISNRNKQKLPDLEARNIFLGGMLAKRATKYRKQKTMNNLTTATRAINGEKQSPSQTKPCPYTKSKTLDVTTNSLQSICKRTNQDVIHYRTISVCPLPRLLLQTFILLGEVGRGSDRWNMHDQWRLHSYKRTFV